MDAKPILSSIFQFWNTNGTNDVRGGFNMELYLRYLQTIQKK